MLILDEAHRMKLGADRDITSLGGLSTEYLQMRIAQIAPLYEAVPPRLYGGTERIVAHLTDALVDLGHEVTLFAAADARTRATPGAGARPGDPAGSRAA